MINGQLGNDPQRLWKYYLWQCWSWGSIDGQLGKDPWRLCKDYLWQCWSLGRGLIDGQLGKDPQRLWKDYFWQCDPGGSIDIQLGKDLQRLWKDYLWQCWSWGINWQSTWKGSTKTLQGLPMTILILEGAIDDQLGKDLPKRLWKDYLWQCWSWGVDWWSTWKGSTKTLEGYLWQCWSLGVNQQSTWKGSAKTLIGLLLTMLILGGWSTVNLGRICKDFGVDCQSTPMLIWGWSTECEQNSSHSNQTINNLIWGSPCRLISTYLTMFINWEVGPNHVIEQLVVALPKQLHMATGM